jgi:hypothetical protein
MEIWNNINHVSSCLLPHWALFRTTNFSIQKKENSLSSGEAQMHEIVVVRSESTLCRYVV